MSSTPGAKKNSVSPNAPRLHGFRPFFFFLLGEVDRISIKWPKAGTHTPPPAQRPRRKSVSSTGKPRHYIVRTLLYAQSFCCRGQTAETEKYESTVNEIRLQSPITGRPCVQGDGSVAGDAEKAPLFSPHAFCETSVVRRAVSAPQNWVVFFIYSVFPFPGPKTAALFGVQRRQRCS